MAYAAGGICRSADQGAADGKAYIEQDDHIAGAGAVGVWTKADSVTAFDDFWFGAKKI